MPSSSGGTYIVAMTRKRKFTASVWREGKWFVAQCLEVDVATQGRSESAALSNLADALALHFDAPQHFAGVEIDEVKQAIAARGTCN